MKLFKEQLLGGHTAIASWLVLRQASTAHRHKDKKGVLWQGGRALTTTAEKGFPGGTPGLKTRGVGRRR